MYIYHRISGVFRIWRISPQAAVTANHDETRPKKSKSVGLLETKFATHDRNSCKYGDFIHRIPGRGQIREGIPALARVTGSEADDRRIPVVRDFVAGTCPPIGQHMHEPGE